MPPYSSPRDRKPAIINKIAGGNGGAAVVSKSKRVF